MATTHKQQELLLEGAISQLKELHRTLEIVVLDSLAKDEDSLISDQVRSVSMEIITLAHLLVPVMVRRGRS